MMDCHSGHMACAIPAVAAKVLMQQLARKMQCRPPAS